jgi:hypothetical protein
MEKRTYLILAGLGFVLPYSQFILFLIENGFNYSLIVYEITEYRLSTFAWLDVLVTAIVIIVVILEKKERISRWWLPLVATILIGPSCGLPLLLFLKQ